MVQFEAASRRNARKFARCASYQSRRVTVSEPLRTQRTINRLAISQYRRRRNIKRQPCPPPRQPSRRPPHEFLSEAASSPLVDGVAVTGASPLQPCHCPWQDTPAGMAPGIARVNSLDVRPLRPRGPEQHGPPLQAHSDMAFASCRHHRPDGVAARRGQRKEVENAVTTSSPSADGGTLGISGSR